MSRMTRQASDPAARVAVARPRTASEVQGLDSAVMPSPKRARPESPRPPPTSEPVSPQSSDRSDADAYLRQLEQLTAPRHPTTNVVRTAARKKIAETLSTASGGFDPAIVAAEVEAALFELSGGQTNDVFRKHCRRLLFNLGDDKNAALRERVLRGAIPAGRLVGMSNDELANPELQAEKRESLRFTTEATLDRPEQGAVSEAFKCAKCGNRKCTYTQIQIRRADEPMTTFVNCTVCDHRWKF